MSTLEIAGNLIEHAALKCRRLFMGIQIPTSPHLDEASRTWFTQRLRQSKSYLEFGSGGSTFESARLGVATISVENDISFGIAMRRRIPEGADTQIIISDLGISRKWGKPVFTNPTPRRLQKWSRYVDSPFEMLERESLEFPDLVLVDGRLRRACALETTRRAMAASASTTLCIDDFTDRPDLAPLTEKLGQPLLHGRMAVFQISPNSPPISRSEVDEAFVDYE